MGRELMPVSQTLLETIQDSVQQFAEAIAKTMDADVLIVDNNLNVIGKTGFYFRLYSPVDINCVVGQVLLGQKNIIIKDRKSYEPCRRCPAYEECQIAGLIGVPIFHETRAVGVIALVLPGHRIAETFREGCRAVSFLENMAELLSGMLNYNDEYTAARQMGLEREQVLDCLEEGVVCTDKSGVVLYYNQAFVSMFGFHENLRGENLLALLPHRILREYLQNRTAIRNLKISLEHGKRQFYGFLSCRELSACGDAKRLVFSFRSVSNIWADASAAGDGSMVTLEWCRGWLLNEDVIDRAKSLAVTDAPVLIQGPDLSLNEIAAKGVCNYSDRSAMGMVSVFCNNIYREFFEQFLFSRFGEIQRANHGTLLFHDVENLPLYLQERLLDFMKTKEIILDNSEVIKSDVRIVFTTTRDLKEMSEQGFFLEELYYRLADNKIQLSPVQCDRTRLAAMLDSGLEFYKARYGKPSVYLSKGVKLRLLNRSWEKNPNEIDKVLERVVRSGDGQVTEKDLAAMGIFRNGNDTVSAISEMEKEKIEKLLNSGYSKVEIARMLGIGRATLYRKMAEYHLNENNK